MNQSSWKYSTIHKSTCKVIDEQILWGQTVCRVWLPNQDAVVRVSQSDLLEPGTQSILYVSATAKVSEILNQSTLNKDLPKNRNHE